MFLFFFGLILLFCLIGYLFGNIFLALIISKIKKINIRKIGSGNIGATNSLRAMGKKIGILVLLVDFLKSYLATFICLVLYKTIAKNHLNPEIYSKFGVIIYLGGFMAIVGHCFPIIYLFILFKTKFDFKIAQKYSGGKGISSTAGFMASISPWFFLICAVVFWSLVLISKYVSLSSLITAFLIPFFSLIPYLNYFYLLNVINADVVNIPNLNKAYKIIDIINYQKKWQYILTLFLINTTITCLVFYKHKDNIKRLKNKNENKITSKIA